MRLSPISSGLLSILIICSGLGRAIYVHVVLDPRTGKAARIDDRYRDLRRALPPDSKLAYVSDEPRGILYQQALYALAPHVFVDQGAAAKYAVADLHDPLRLSEVCRAGGWRPVATFSGGAVALLEHDR